MRTNRPFIDGSVSSFNSHLHRESKFLGQVGQILGSEAATSPEAAVRKGAEELVASAFFKPIFAMVREDPLRSDVIPMSSGEKMFGPLLDAEFSKRITERADFPITEAIVKRMMSALSRSATEQPTPSSDSRRPIGVDSHA